MAFKLNELGNDLNHGIIYGNEPIPCTHVCLAMDNNVEK
jgi:hypothetical protein